jgi:hypothetical protein
MMRAMMYDGQTLRIPYMAKISRHKNIDSVYAILKKNVGGNTANVTIAHFLQHKVHANGSPSAR